MYATPFHLDPLIRSVTYMLALYNMYCTVGAHRPIFSLIVFTLSDRFIVLLVRDDYVIVVIVSASRYFHDHPTDSHFAPRVHLVYFVDYSPSPRTLLFTFHPHHR